MKMRVADYIMSRLVEAGTDTVFMLSGGGMMHLVDAVGRCEGLRYICNHNEQPSAMAADAWARRSGKTGVCLATSGPGATNIITGLAGAWQDSSPVLFLTGQVKTSQTIALSGIQGLRQFGTFEIDIVPVVLSLSKYAVMVSDPSTIRYHLEKALWLATHGRPGPVLLDLPLDVQGATVEIDSLEGFTPPPSGYQINQDALASVARALAEARRPLLLAGAGVGCANARQAFQSLAEQLGIPVVTSQLGKDAIAWAHPLFVGHPGPKGDRPGNLAIQSADVILSLGCSLHSQTTGWENDLFAPDALKIQVDPDPAVLAREQVGVSLKIECDVTSFMTALTGLKPVAPDATAWRASCASWKERYAVSRESHDRTAAGINFYDLAEVLSEKLPRGSCIVADAGSAFYVMGQAFRLKDGQRFISSGSLGAMGFALPAANGAACAGEEVTVCVTGDGSLMTNVHDLATMSHNKMNLKLFVINNEGYLSIRNTQRDFFGGFLVGTDEGSGVFIPPMDKLADSYNLPFLCCEKAEDLENTVSRALAMPGPVFVEIKAVRDQKIIPAVTSVRLPNGMMKSMSLHEMSPLLPEGVVQAELDAARNGLPVSA